jgi:hypothetical protein
MDAIDRELAGKDAVVLTYYLSLARRAEHSEAIAKITEILRHGHK